MADDRQTDVNPDDRPWYAEVTRYQWLVLVIASLGWVFDIFEGQIFVASMREAMPSLVDKAAFAQREGFTDPAVINDRYNGLIAFYNNIALGSFLLGGALGGIVFGMMSDRVGRKRTMTVTIIFYTAFTFVSAFSQEWWQLAGFRFLVAMGVGGEWAVASAMVAEVFPNRARARVLGIFHASSVLGTWLAIAAGTFIIGGEAVKEWALSEQLAWTANYVDPATLPWRIGFGIGVLPALLIIWIRRSLREPESWQAARSRAAGDVTEKMGRIAELFHAAHFRNTLVGLTLAAVGLATFWGAHIYGKDLLLGDAKESYLAGVYPAGTDLSTIVGEERTSALKPFESRLKRWEMLGMFLVTTGGGLGLICFGPICERVGRRATFLFYHLGGLAAALVTFQYVNGTTPVIIALPIFGFLTLGMHAGYAIYFPELFPTRLRSTGAGFCFNAGRILAAPILFLSGWMQKGLMIDTRETRVSEWIRLKLELFPVTLNSAATLLSLLFLVGAIVLLFAPETRGRDLPE